MSARRLSVAPGVFPGVSPRLPDFFTPEFPIHGCPHNYTLMRTFCAMFHVKQVKIQVAMHIAKSAT